MKEQSQIEEMRAAVRGDRERAEQARQRSIDDVAAETYPRPAALPVAEPSRGVAARRRSKLRGLFKRR